MYDPLRGWYFFTKEEQQKTISGTRAGTPFLEEEIDSTKQTAWQRNLESWRKALDIAQADKFKPVAKASGADISYYTKDSAFRGLRDWGEEYSESVMGPTYLPGFGGKVASKASGFWKYGSFYNDLMDKQKAAGLDRSSPLSTPYDRDVYKRNKFTDEELFKSYQDAEFYDSFENTYLLKHLWFDSFRILIKTQRQAAENAGFDKKVEGERSYTDEIGFSTYSIPDVAKNIIQTKYSPYYLDFEKDLPVATTPDMLQSQLDLIDGYEDRNHIQKAYLHQKAINRFWVNEISKRGGLEELHKFTTDIETSEMVYPSFSPFGGTSMGTSYGTYTLGTPKPFLYNLGSGRDTKYLYAWQNSGEGFTPDSVEYTSSDMLTFDETQKMLTSTLLEEFYPDIKTPSKPDKKTDITGHFDDSGELSHVSYKGHLFGKDELTDMIIALKATEPLRDEMRDLFDTDPERAISITTFDVGDSVLNDKLNTLAGLDEERYKWVLASLNPNNSYSTHSDKMSALVWLVSYFNGEADLKVPVPPLPIAGVVREKPTPEISAEPPETSETPEISAETPEISDELRTYFKEEHNLDITRLKDIPDYFTRDAKGDINLYGTQSKEDPRVRSSTDTAGITHAIWAPEIVHKTGS